MKYSRDHAWADLSSDGMIAVGITVFAAAELGEISFIELPELGKSVNSGDPVCSIDSLKSTSDIYAPVSGEIVKVNETLHGEDGLRLLNEDPAGAGWVFALKTKNNDEYEDLLDEDSYAQLTGN